MKTNLKSLLALLMLGAATLTLRAQYNAQPQSPGQPPQDQQGQQGPPDQQGSGPQGGHHHRPPPSRLFIALDANHDGVIDANEIANASAAVTTLASEVGTNGTLTWAEICPKPPARPNGGEDNAGPGDQNNPPPQDGQQGQGQGPGQHHRPPPDKLFTALDANHDGAIDASEIANAPAALKALDKNGDGQLTRNELRPQHPPRPEGDNGGNQNGNPDNDRPAGPPPGGQNDGPPPQ